MEVSAVQGIKQLGAELELFRFGHFEILKDADVKVCISRTEIHIAAFVAKLSRVGSGIESLKSAGVKPLANRTGPLIGIANEIGSLSGESGNLRRAALRRNVVRVEDGKRCSAHQRGNAIQLPSAER